MLRDSIEVASTTLSTGSIYALIALGIAMLFSILRLVNFAHGELMVIGAYAMVGVHAAGLPFAFMVVGAPLAAIALALALERLVFRPARGAPDATLLMMSFTVSVMLQALFLFAFGGTPKDLQVPGWTTSHFSLGGVEITWFDVATFGLVMVVLAVLTLVLRRTIIGIALRAAAEDFAITRLMGIRADWVVVAAFVVSGLLAGLAAVMWFTNAALVGPNDGTAPLLAGFIAAILGGLGTLTGAVLGGFLLGFIEAMFQTFLGTTLLPYASAFVYAAVIVVLLVRPRGLLSRTVEVV